MGRLAAVAAAFIAACFLARLGAAESLSAVPAEARFALLKSELTAEVAKGTFPSLAIAVIQDGKVLWAEAYGWADKEEKISAGVDTRYALASVGKSITATAMMTLVENRKVKLSDPVAKVLGKDAFQVLSGGTGPTIRQLLDMTSGIPHGALTYNQGLAPSEADLLSRRAFVVFRPGTVFHYSNFSIAFADRVIEKVTGSDFGSVLRTRVFEPLGMSNATLELDAGKSAAAARYDEDGKRIGRIETMPRSSRAMNASLSDMVGYAAYFLKTPMEDQKRILSDASIDALLNERPNVPGARLALGWGSLDIGEGRKWIVSSGNDMGVQASITLLPHARAGVVVLTNKSGYEADEIGIRAADTVVPGFAAAAAKIIKSFEANAEPFQAPTDWVGKWVGTIKAKDRDIPASVTIGSDSAIKVALDGQYPTLLDEATLTDGMLTGAFLGKVPLEEMVDRYHRVELGLLMNGDTLSGFALVNFRSDRGKFEIPTFMTLTRQATSKP
jgi:CubicO group peptidase (beta-lactamase class C family)